MLNYYTELQHFHSRTNQIGPIADSVALTLEKKESLIFVDIGSSDGELTQRVLQALSAVNPKIQTYACEPDAVPSYHLKRRFLGDTSVHIDTLNYAGWIARYGETLHDCVDLFLNSHTFYHYPSQSWNGVIEQTSRFLSVNGNHAVILDSQDTSINQLKDVLFEKIDKSKKTDAYGAFIYGSDFERVLIDGNTAYEHQAIDQPIIIPANNALAEFARVLAFVFRFKSEDILTHASTEIGAFLESYQVGGEYRLPRFQDMFVFGKSVHS